MVFFMMLKSQSLKNLWEYVGVAELENYLFILGKVWGFHHPTPKVFAYKSRGELFLWKIIFASTNPQYDNRLFIVDENVRSEYLQNMLSTKIVVFVLFWHLEQF